MAEPLHSPQARRSILRTAIVAGVTMLLAACQVVPKRAPPPPPPPPPERPQQTPGLPETEDRNRVAVLVPLTGSNSGVGRSIANASNLALLDTGGEVIRITVYDTAAAGGAAAAANQALADGNGLILGPLLSTDVAAIAPVARRGNVPVIAFSNDVSVAGNGVYVLGFDPAQAVDRVVSYARGQGLTRFAGLAPNGDYGRRASQALIASVEQHGGRMVAMQNYDRTQASIRSAVQRLSGQSPYDAVLIADSAQFATIAAPLVRAGPSAQARILGTELWKTEPSLARQPALKGALFATVSDTLFNQLRTRYRARYGVTPYRLASLGYDATLLAIRIGRNWKVGARFPGDALRDPEGFSGVDGTFRFGRDGVAERTLEVQQIDASGFTTVSSAPRSFGG